MTRSEFIVSTGIEQRVDPFGDRLGSAYDYAVKSETHLWIATIAHKVGDQALDAYEGTSDELMHLDAESMLLMPTVGCYVCEAVYEPRLRRRKCPGEPAGQPIVGGTS